MANDISSIHSTILAISYLEENEKSKVMKHWRDRFALNTAIWVDAAEESKQAILEKLRQELIKNGISHMVTQPCILVFFLDLTKPFDEAVMSPVWTLAQDIKTMLQCRIQIVMQYAYVGMLGIESLQIQRNNIAAMVGKNSAVTLQIQHRLCMVATPVLNPEGGNNWKAAVIMLDLLRRQPNPTDILPNTDDDNSNNDIAFLRYGEYDTTKAKELQEKLDEVTERLEGSNGDKLTQHLQQLLSSYDERVGKNFAIYASMQPQHPDMKISGVGFFHCQRRAAKRGKNVEYNHAARETAEALRITANRMAEDIHTLFHQQTQKAQEWLKDVLQETRLSCSIKRDSSAMLELLQQKKFNRCSESVPDTPSLDYNREGNETEIKNYLEKMRDYALFAEKCAFVEAVCEAYKAIQPQTFAEEEQELQQKQRALRLELMSIKTAEDFAKNMTGQNDPPECEFFPTAASGDWRKWVIARGEDMKKALTTKNIGNNDNVYEIHETNGGIVALDTAPMKAIQYATFNYSNDTIDQFLPEVRQ